MSGRVRHHPVRVIVTGLTLAALGAGAGPAAAQPHLPVPPLPPVPAGHPPLPPPPPPLPAPPLPPPPTVVVDTAPADGPAYYPPPAGQPAAAPPAQPAQPPPVINGWQPDDPVPEGYRKISKPNVGYLGIGIGMFSAGWVSAVVAAAAETDAASKAKDPGALRPSAWLPLFFPLAGPFITIVSAKQGPAGMGLLLCDGIFQAAGVLGIIVGATRWTHRLVRVGGVDLTLDVSPAAGPGFAGIQTIGQF